MIIPVILMLVTLLSSPHSAHSESQASRDSQWVQVLSGGAGDVERMMINVMTEFQGQLYAGAYHPVTGCEIWRSADGTQWEPVVGPGAPVASGFGTPNNEQVTVLIPIHDSLFAGVWNTKQGAELWRSDTGLAWQPVVGGTAPVPNGFGKLDTGIIALTVFRDLLFAGTGSRTKNNAELWVSHDWGINWEPIAGERTALRLALGSQSSYLQDLVVFGDALYVAVGNPGQGAEIWRTQDGWNWEAVVGAPAAYAAGLGNANWDMIFAMEPFKDLLYAAVTSFRVEAPGVLWRSADGQTWEVIQPPEWMENPAQHHGFGDLVAIEDALYVSSTPSGGAVPHVWMSRDGQRWARITDDETFRTANAIPVLYGFRGALYAGTFSYTRGASATKSGAAIWRLQIRAGSSQSLTNPK